MANVKLTYINSTGGYVQSTSTSDVVQSIGKIELTGVAGVALDANNAKISNLATPAASGDAATKGYVDSLVSGLSWVQPVVAVGVSAVTLSGSQTVDGVALTNGSRVLITGQNGSTADAANGIYIVNTGGAWTRASDTLQSGTAMFVQEGTTYKDTQWVLTTDVSPIVPGTTPIMFAQAGAGTSYSAGNGLSLTGTTFAVDLATDSGLEFSAGKIKIDPASADQLSLDASGLNVVGVPSQFKIAGTQVSTNVTATNLDSLTDSSSIVGLHRHAAVYTQGTSGGNITALYPVYVSNSTGYVLHAAANSTGTANVTGIAITSQTALQTFNYVTHGTISGFSGLNAGEVYFLPDTAGTPVEYSSITSGNRIIRLGVALSSSVLDVMIQDMGVKP